jgi:hypothetical protein
MGFSDFLTMRMDTIKYLEYQILAQEISLYDEYPKDHPYMRDKLVV